jgi:hypothetical protein
MTLGEFIKLLETFDPDRVVLVDGYESNYDLVDSLHCEDVVFEPGAPYEGHYRLADKYDEAERIPGLIISRPIHPYT